MEGASVESSAGRTRRTISSSPCHNTEVSSALSVAPVWRSVRVGGVGGGGDGGGGTGAPPFGWLRRRETKRKNDKIRCAKIHGR